MPEPGDLTFFAGHGYYLDFAETLEHPDIKHRIAGTNEVPGAVCNGHGCGRPFLRMLTLDLLDPKLAFITNVGIRELPLFYCWRCGGWPDYRLLPSGDVEVIGRSSTGPEKDFPYPDYPMQFPAHRAVLTPLTTEIQKIVHERNAGTLDSELRFGASHEPYLRPRHQVGGEPYLVQGSDRDGQDCPSCHLIMPLLATAGDETGGALSFAGNAFAQVLFYYCASCQVVSACHECD